MDALLTINLAFALATAPAPLDATPQTRLDPDLRCLLGAYALPAGKFVTITGADGQPRGLSYTLSNGQFGSLAEQLDGSFSAGSFVIRFSTCSAARLKLSHHNKAQSGVRLRLAEKETSFKSDGINLHGKLVLPAGGRSRVAAVWIEGSNNNPTTDDTVWQYELARRGVATFVYDKRGTGGSGGPQTSDFNARARDTAAAVEETRRLAPTLQRIGVLGGSQGGWVAPLTATKTHLDFVIAAFAMAEGPIAQDKALVEQQLRAAGYGDTILVDARELTGITEQIVRTNMQGGLEALDAFKAKHASASWLDAIQPRSYTGLLLKVPTEQIKIAGPTMAQGLSFDFEPRPIIEGIKPRQLWLLAGSDTQAPNAATQTILRQIQQKRSDIVVIVFPKADHGLVESMQTADGAALAYSSRIFDIAADWIKTDKRPTKNRFHVMPPAN